MAHECREADVVSRTTHRFTRGTSLVVVFSLIALAACARPVASPAHAADAVTPPGQPASGPGGAEYPHQGVKAARFGEGDDEYWIFSPEDPRPEKAPVVVFLHGWGGTRPSGYGGWLRHLVREGNIVIYPRFQDSLRTPVRELTPNALKAVREAYKRLEGDFPIKPEPGKLALIGHSIGGYIAANLMGTLEAAGLPAPRAVLFASPGNGSANMRNKERLMELRGLERTPSSTYLMAVLADRDRFVKPSESEQILRQATQVPSSNKSIVLLQTDEHTSPPLVADHFACMSRDRSFVSDGAGDEDEAAIAEMEGVGDEDQAESQESDESSAGAGDRPAGRGRGGLRGRIRERIDERREGAEQSGGGRLGRRGGDSGSHDLFGTDTLDYYGYWRLTDGLLSMAFNGTPASSAYVQGGSTTSMGTCSDGSPVKPLKVRTAP